MDGSGFMGVAAVSERVLRSVVGVVFVVLVGGCASIMDARKGASMERAQVRDVAGVEVATFARTRTAVLLTGTDEVSDLQVVKRNVKGKFQLNGKVCRTIGGCAAVPIDVRGYWLTARHCLDLDAALVYQPGADGTEQTVQARIVWKGDGPGQDIALLYAPLGQGVVPVAVADEARSGARVVCVGSGIKTDRLSAGRVIGVGGTTDDSLVWLVHDAPLTAGDSGGAAFYEDGMLAGINVEAGTAQMGKVARATAIQPDMEAIIRLIEEDWSRQTSSN